MAEEQATLAGGCFWCTEAVFLQLAGVSAVESGYIGGSLANPSYEEVCSGRTGHAEAIRISFDPQVISYDDLLDVFFATHDPTQLNQQGNDIARAQADHVLPIVTTIEPLATWYPAEGYHQDYWNRVGTQNGYCMAVIPPKLQKLRKKFAEKLAG
jgi:peptide-methionine (S)-S-oxide reductase